MRESEGVEWVWKRGHAPTLLHAPPSDYTQHHTQARVAIGLVPRNDVKDSERRIHYTFIQQFSSTTDLVGYGEYGLRAYTTPDSVVSYVNHAHIA